MEIIAAWPSLCKKPAIGSRSVAQCNIAIEAFSTIGAFSAVEAFSGLIGPVDSINCHDPVIPFEWLENCDFYHILAGIALGRVLWGEELEAVSLRR